LGELCVYAFYVGNFEAEFHAWGCEGTEHCAACAVYVDGYIDSCFFLVFVEDFGDFGDGFVVSGICGSQDHKNSLNNQRGNKERGAQTQGEGENGRVSVLMVFLSRFSRIFMVSRQ